jgi:hypothetical protein
MLRFQIAVLQGVTKAEQIIGDRDATFRNAVINEEPLRCLLSIYRVKRVYDVIESMTLSHEH